MQFLNETVNSTSPDYSMFNSTTLLFTVSLIEIQCYIIITIIYPCLFTGKGLKMLNLQTIFSIVGISLLQKRL